MKKFVTYLIILCMALPSYAQVVRPPSPGGGGGGGYTSILDEGTPLTARTKLNFTGSGVTCADNAGSTRTDCTIGGGASGAANVLQVSDGAGSLAVATAGTFSTSLTGPLYIGSSGDNKDVFPAVTTTGQSFRSFVGTAAAPDTSLNPVLKVGRTIAITSAVGVSGDGGQQFATLYGMATGTSTNRVQPVGVYGGCENAGTTNLGGGRNVDCVGLYGIGRGLSGNTGVAIGVFTQARTDSATGLLTGVEIQSFNNTGALGTFSSTAFNPQQLMWLNANGLTTDGTSDIPIGLHFGNPWGVQMQYGITFNGQVNAAKTGPIRSDGAAIRFDDTGGNALLITGNHGVASYVDSSTSPIGINLSGTFATAGIQLGGTYAAGALNVSSNSVTTNTVNVGTTHVNGRKLQGAGTSNSSAQSITGGVFGTATATHSTGNMAQAFGVQGLAFFNTANATATNITTMSGAVGQTQIGANVTNNIGVAAAFYAKAGTDTNAKGQITASFYGEAQTAGAANYGAYLLGTAKNYFAGSVHSASPATQTIAGGDTIIADACSSVKAITASGAVTTNTTNTFTAPSSTAGTGNNGCVMHLCNVGVTNTITLDKNASLFTIGGADLPLAANTCVLVGSDGTQWRQLSAVLTGT